MYELDRVYTTNRKPKARKYVAVSPKGSQVKMVTERDERIVKLNNFMATFNDPAKAKIEYITLVYAEVARLFSSAMAEKVAEVLRSALSRGEP